MRILYFGDGLWATNCLKELLKNDFNIVGVVLRNTPSDNSLMMLAQELNMPVFQGYNVNDSSFIDIVKGLDIDLNISMSFDQKIKKELLALTPLGFINCHAGYLPYYRGRSVINWAIINNEPFIGLTVHYMDEKYDTGDIILQEKLFITTEDDYETVLNKVINGFPKVLLRAVQNIKNNTATRTKQSHFEGSYFPRRIAGDELINWNDTSLNVYNFVRALVRPAVGAVTFCGNRKIIIWKAKLLDAPTYIGIPGQVVFADKAVGIKVKTADSHILIETIQFEGDEKSITPYFKVGTRFKSQIV